MNTNIKRSQFNKSVPESRSVRTTDLIYHELIRASETTVKQLALALNFSNSTVSRALIALESQGLAIRNRHAGNIDPRKADLWTACSREDLTQGQHGRLQRGELRELVYTFLVERPDRDFTASGIGKALMRSPGAISNALLKLECAGRIRQVSQFPRRYRADRMG